MRAKQYGSDAGAKLSATLDGNQLVVWTTAVANQDFVVELPVATALSKIALSAVAGKRVYVDYVKVQTKVPVVGQVSQSGFPFQVGNVLSYTVTGLQSGVTYYYRVTPQGNGAIASNQVTIQTKLNTSLLHPSTNELKYRSTSKGIELSGLQVKSHLNIYSSNGLLLRSIIASDEHLSISLPNHGAYVFQVTNETNVTALKVVW